MKGYCVFLAVCGLVMVGLNFILLILTDSAFAFKLQYTLHFVFGDYGFAGFGLFLMIFAFIAHYKLLEQEKEDMLKSLLK
jgi:hypothetical protein